jgi:hypothetical protein
VSRGCELLGTNQEWDSADGRVVGGRDWISDRLSILTVGDISFLLPIDTSTVVFSGEVLVLHSFEDATIAFNS